MGLCATQLSILAMLKRLGPISISALTEEMVMDRTTLGWNYQPPEREGRIDATTGRVDRRSRELHLTDAGIARLRAASEAWIKAQAQFETVFGGQRASHLRAILRAVTASDLGPAEVGKSGPTL